MAKTITKQGLKHRLDSGRWRVTEYVYGRGKTRINLVNTTTRTPVTRTLVDEGGK